jgi:protein-L-isoaspartate O-methyltransferase
MIPGERTEIRRVLLLLAAGCTLAAQTGGAVQKAAPYFPTPETIVTRMLRLGGLKHGEKMFDLGSGDGRIVIMAAEKFKADATGIEIDDALWKRSSDRIRELGLEKRARIIHGDIFRQDYSAADLLTVYLLPESNDKLQPLLERQLKKGARVVSHDFGFSGWTPEKVVDIDDDGQGRSHRLFLYRR